MFVEDEGRRIIPSKIPSLKKNPRGQEVGIDNLSFALCSLLPSLPAFNIPAS